MQSSEEHTTLLDLPNEILLHVLQFLRTPKLLPLVAINRRIHDLALRLLHHRLLLAATLNGRSLVFECFQPSRKLYESYMLGAYICTPGLDDHLLHPEEDARSQAKAALETELLPGERLATLSNFYSHFRPYRRQAERKVQWKHPAGDVPGSRTYGGGAYYGNNSTVRTFSPAMAYAATPASSAGIGSGLRQWGASDSSSGASATPAQDEAEGAREQTASARTAVQGQTTDPAPPQTDPQPNYDRYINSTDLPASDAQGITSAQLLHQSDIPPPEKVTVHVNLDDSDNLHQLCANVSVFIPGPRPGIFRGFQDVLKDGVLRVWRRWLADVREERVDSKSGTSSRNEATDTGEGQVGAGFATGAEVGGGKGKARVEGQSEGEADIQNPKHDPNILWVGHGSSVGVRFSVKQKKWHRPAPVLMSADEAGPVSYELVYEELLIRTRDLLLASERLDDQQHSENGKAVVFGTFSS